MRYLPLLSLTLALSCKKKMQPPTLDAEPPPPAMIYEAEPAQRSEDVAVGGPPPGTEGYNAVAEVGFESPLDEPLSTFSIDVDTASYSNVRRFLNAGRLPPPDAVRVEELINYFEYDDPAPAGDAPFAVTAEVADCPWAPAHRLVRLGIQATELEQDEIPPRNLVFLVDVSGSMADADKLPLLVASLRMLVDQLRPQDSVAIVTYAGGAGLALPPTSGDRKQEIRAALDALQAGGSTNGSGGIKVAYDVAARGKADGSISRVVLATDGDFNVGVTSQAELIALIEQERQRGVFLTVLGLGTGNLQDGTMERLADAGNGVYAYLDSLSEAHKVLVAQASGSLVTIARDVKIQVELNPREVSSYRLIGYENRALAARDFNDDRKDAGDIGAGHHVTALYEIVPAGAESSPGVDPLRYQQAPPPPLSGAAESGELMAVKVRYQPPEGGQSALLAFPVPAATRPAAQASAAWRWSAAVAAWGMLLRGSPHRGAASFAMVQDLAAGARGEDRDGYQAEFLRLVALSSAL